MKFRDIREAPKTAVLAFGRMNPPTIGHKKLADKVASLPGDPYIFVSQSQKPKTDPLSFQDKLKYAKASFPNVTVGSSDVKTIIQALQKIEAMGYDSIIYVAGSDRIQDFTNLINKYNGKDYNFSKIDVVSAGERDPDAEGAEGMSASKMRAAAAAGDFDSFKQGVANPKIAQQMFTDVRKGMGITEILGFVPKRSKRATIKKKPEKFEPSVQDKIAARRKAAAKGDKNAWKSGVKTLEGAMNRMATSLANKADRTASTNKLKPGLDTYKKKPKKTNEAYKLQLERGKDIDVLHIVDTKTGGRTEVRGKPGYESGNYDANDKLHQLLDRVGKSANISELINGEVVSINPKHPDATKAKAAADKAYNEDVNIDNKDGWGSVPWNQEVDYRGMRVKMKPSVFEKLALSRGGEPAVDKVVQHIKNGGSIGAPFLNIRVDDDDSQIPEVVGQEGRSRMLAIHEVHGDVPVEVHLFFQGKVNRARHITPEFKEKIQRYLISQNDVMVRGPLFSESVNENFAKGSQLDSLRKFVRSQREAPDQVLYQMMMAPDTYGHEASNFVRSWYEDTKEENGLNDVDSALEIMVDQLGLNENFADGKKKGKSRPGRVKRAGASCKGSVTKLRKQAKNASGEKARMYHWCANMKSGRKKK